MVNALACRGPAPEPPPVPTACERLPVPPFVAGANVIDRPDDDDGDPENDGDRGYGSDAARTTLRHLRGLGLTGVVLPVEVRLDGPGDTSVTPSPLATPEGLARLGRMIDDAHREGMVVAVVPHLKLDDGSWRGYLTFEPRAREAFFASYRRALRPIAERAEAHCAEAFSFALELKGLTSDEGALPAFRALIDDVRRLFRGGLTYSANWDEVDAVPFWPLLDGIGVNAFFPLEENASADDAALAEGALRVQRRLLALQHAQKKPVWLMELGFKATPSSWVEPWLWPAEVGAESLPVDEEAQGRAYRAVIDAVRAVPAVGAVFFWAVPADPHDVASAAPFEPRQGFSFVGKAAEAEVRALAQRPPRR